MNEMSISKQMAAPPERVWEIVTDVASYADVISGITAVEQLDELDSFGAGTQWRETRVMFGKKATEVMAVTAIEPGREYTVEAESHGTHYTSVISVAAADGGTLLKWTFVGEPLNLMAKVMAMTVGRAFEGSTRKMMEKDYEDIAAAAESR